MALFISTLRFDIDALDLHADFQGDLTVTDYGSHVVSFDAAPFGFLGINAQLPGFEATVETDLNIATSTGFITHVFADGLSYTSDGILTAGTIRTIEATIGADYAYELFGIATSAADFSAATQTQRFGDDRAVMMQMLSGNDNVYLSHFDDNFKSGGGKDLIIDSGGNDTIRSGAGADFVYVGDGRDRVAGGAGDDLILGGNGNDKLFGQAGDDVFLAGKGHDTITGGSGADSFVFTRGDGTNVITDYQAGTDHILFIGKVAGLANLNITQVGDDTHVSFANVTLILQHVDSATISADDIGTGGGPVLVAAATDFVTDWVFAL